LAGVVTVEADHTAQQQQIREEAIACLHTRLARYQQTPVELKVQLQPHLEILSALQHKLSEPLLQIAVFGLVSRGKSAVLNALFGESLFPTGSFNGVTQWPRSVRWALAGASDLQLELIDTPGLNEISGETRALMAKDIAHCADLILFVTAGPPMPVEQAALAELAQLRKPILWVVNKADLYPDLTAEMLYQS
jgi:predicted GTPase